MNVDLFFTIWGFDKVGNHIVVIGVLNVCDTGNPNLPAINLCLSFQISCLVHG